MDDYKRFCPQKKTIFDKIAKASLSLSFYKNTNKTCRKRELFAAGNCDNHFYLITCV